MKKIFTWIKSHPATVIIIITFLIYGKTLFFSYTNFDDSILIKDNQQFFQNPSNIFKAFTEDVFHARKNQMYYRPLLIVSLFPEAWTTQENLFSYHLFNITLHIIATILLEKLLQKLTRNATISRFLALFFLVHPVLTQAVAWIPGRNDSLLAVFVFASFLNYLNYINSFKIRPLIWHLLFFAAALFTKESAFILPLPLILYSFLLHKKSLNVSITQYLFLGWSGIITFWYLMHKLAIINPAPYSIQSAAQSAWNGLPSIIQYLGKVFLPFNLSVLPTIQDTTFIYGFLSLILLLTALLLSRQKNTRLIIFGTFWFLIFLLPSLANGNVFIKNDFLEHRLYVPFLGILLLIAQIDYLNKPISFIRPRLLAPLILVTLGLTTFTHLDVFQNNRTFWKSAVSTSPHLALAHRVLGQIYFTDNQYELAEKHFHKAIEVDPHEKNSHTALGFLYYTQKKFPEAIAEYNQELALDSENLLVHLQLGTLYHESNEKNQAEKHFLKAIEINPEDPSPYLSLSRIYQEQGDFFKAQTYELKAIRQDNLNNPQPENY